MRHLRIRWVFAALAAVAVATTALGQGNPWVTQGADGSFVLKSVYPGDTVTFAPGELGALITNAWQSRGTKPFQGITLNVVTLQAGDKGAISGGIINWVPAFEELTGAKVNVVQKPFDDLAPVMFNDVRTGTGAYDGFIVPMAFMGSLVSGNFIVPLNDYMKSNEYPTVFDNTNQDPTQWGLDGVLEPSLQRLYRWGSTWYASPWDSDGVVLYYRKDVLQNADAQAAYKAATGNDLVVPSTLEELVQEACYFNGKDPLGTGKALYGIVEPAQIGSQFFEYYRAIAAQYGVVPGGASQGFSQTLQFDPTDMQPLINNPAAVKGLETLVNLYKCGPKDPASIDLGTSFNMFAQGDAVFQVNFGDTGTIVESPDGNSPVKGHLGVAPVPGSMQVYNVAQKSWQTLDKPNHVGNEAGASWSGMVSSLSRHPEATYALFAFLSSPSMHLWNARWGFDGVDLGRHSDFLPPNGNANIENYLSAGFNASDIKEISDAYATNFTEKAYEYLRIPGTPDYDLALEQNLQAAITGQMTPQAALDQVAKRWNDTTDQTGRQGQISVFQESLK